MKKMIVLVMTVIMLILSLPVASLEAEEPSQRVIKSFEILNKLNVLSEKLSEFDATDIITRAEFVSDVLRLMGISDVSEGTTYFNDVPPAHWAYDQISCAVEIGLIYGSGSGHFLPEDLIKRSEAEIILLRVLNYGELLKSDYGASRISTYVKNAKLLDGVSVTGNTIDRGNAYVMMLNALNAKYLSENIISGDTLSYDTDNAKSLMEVFLSVKRVEGLVYADEDAGLFGRKRLANGYVMIGDDLYLDQSRCCRRLLGHKVEAYVRTENPYEVVAAYSDDKVKTEIIKADDLWKEHSDFDEFCIVAEDDDGDEQKYFLAPQYDCLYNGELYSDFTEDIFKLDTGEIQLIDIDNDSVFDIVMILNYTNVFVESVSAYYKMVWDKYTGAPLDLSNTEEIEIYWQNGKEASFEDISEKMVLSVYLSPSGEVKKVYLCDKYKALIPDSLNHDDNTFTAGDETYIIAASLVPYQDIALKQSIVCYFDYLGEIAAIEELTKSFYYGYLLAVNDAKMFDWPKLQILTENSEVVVYSLDENIYYNGENTKTNSQTVVDRYKENGEVKRQLIKYYVNNDGLVTKLWKFDDRSSEGGNNPENKFSMDYISKVNSEYRSGEMCHIDSKYVLNADTKIFCVSRNLDDDVNDFTCSSFQIMKETSSGMDFELYDIEEDFTVPVMVNYQGGDSTYSRNDPIIVIDKVVRSVDEEGLERYKVYGYSGNSYVSYLMEDDVEDKEGDWAAVFKGVKPTDLKRGDVIQYKINMGNIITEMRVLHSYKSYPNAFDEQSDGTITAERMYANFYASSADVISHKGNNLIVLSNRLSEDPNERHIRTIQINKINEIYLYDSDNDKLSVANVNENFDNCRIFFALSINDVKMLVLYK